MELREGWLRVGRKWVWAFDVVLELLKATLLLTSTRATRLFCDVYNPQSKTYCKRLQVLCPEHSRDPKVRFLLKSPASCPTLLPVSHLCGLSLSFFLLSSCQLLVPPFTVEPSPIPTLCLLFTVLQILHSPSRNHAYPSCLCRCQLMRSVGVH